MKIIKIKVTALKLSIKEKFTQLISLPSDSATFMFRVFSRLSAQVTPQSVLYERKKELREVFDILEVAAGNKFAVYSRPFAKGFIVSNCSLGLQYGVGVTKLTDMITFSTKTAVTIDETRKLVDQHKKLFRKFWDWAEETLRKYKRQRHLTVWDGWSMMGDNDSDLSVKNWSIQTTGAVIMRVAVAKAKDYGVKVMNPLHDAIYVRCKVEDIETTEALLQKAMDEAVMEVLGSFKIRVDTDVHKHDEDWIEEKGEANFEKLGKWLKPKIGGEVSRIKRIKEIMEVYGV